MDKRSDVPGAKENRVNLFDRALSVPAEEIQILLHGDVPAPWSEFRLNRRRICGSHFITRWSQAVWSKEQLIGAVDETGGYFALPYGPASVAPDDDIRSFELYFERLENAQPAGMKRPDLLLFRSIDREAVTKAVERLGGESELPFTPETHAGMHLLLRRAILAVKCESSLWIARDVPGWDTDFKPTSRLAGETGLKKNAGLPKVILSEENRSWLSDWQKRNRVPIHLWHVFFNSAFGLPLAEAQKLIDSGLIDATEQNFQAPSGTTTKKVVYDYHRQYAYPLASSLEPPELRANFLEDNNGHILPYVKFVGGSLSLAREAVGVLSEAARAAIAVRPVCARPRGARQFLSRRFCAGRAGPGRR
jgi:hypothetical protein